MKLVCFFDGSCAPVNPGGTAQYGFIIRRDHETIRRGWGCVGTGEGMTNNVAEASGLTALLECLIADFAEATEVFIYGDSSIVIKQMNGMARKEPKGAYKSYLIEAKLRAQRLRQQCPKLYFQWVPREQNQEADAVAEHQENHNYWISAKFREAAARDEEARTLEMARQKEMGR